jgi:hypothetical protein
MSGRGVQKHQQARCLADIESPSPQKKHQENVCTRSPCQKPVTKQPTEIQCQCLLGFWVLSHFWVFLSEDSRKNTTINFWQKDHVGNLLQFTKKWAKNQMSIGGPPGFFLD